MSNHAEVSSRTRRRPGTHRWRVFPLLAFPCCWFLGQSAWAQTPLGTAFTYQGRLTSAGAPATGSYDLRFTLYDSLDVGSAVGSPLTRAGVAVTNGLFTVSLDFGAVFAGSRRWLEVGVKPTGDPGGYSLLAPRSELTPTPGALWSSKAGDSASLGGIAPADVVTVINPGGGVSLARVGNTATVGLLTTCATGQVLKAGVVAGTWSCANDTDTNRGGTVTSVGSGAGLIGGTITGTGSLSIAPGGVATSMIANNAVGAAQIAIGAVGSSQINTAQVQARVGSSCVVGSSIRAVNADGTVNCQTDSSFSAASCATVSSGFVPLNSYYTSIIATCGAGTFPVSGGYGFGAWNTVDTCIPIRSQRISTGWQVTWGAATPSVCAAHTAETLVYCCP